MSRSNRLASAGPIDMRKVARSHVSSYPVPVVFSAGDQLTVGRSDDEYPEWVWVKTVDGTEGWAPESFLAIEGTEGTALLDYDSTELDTSKGELVTVLRETGGWILVRNSADRTGWVPAETLGKPDEK